MGGEEAAGYGPLVADPQGVLDLPEGFTYRVISQAGREMDDGLLVPGKQDGAAAFPLPGGGGAGLEPVPADREPRGGPEAVPAGAVRLVAGAAGPGSIAAVYMTTATADSRGWAGARRTCTTRGAAGWSGASCRWRGRSGTAPAGRRPWGSWISCEETNTRAGGDIEQDHGYCFEVPATVEIKPADPVPLTAMGRFNHEAIAVDPVTGIVYLTEDRQDGAFFRFIPATPGRLQEGGRLQALALIDRPSHDTRNWLGKLSEEEAAKYEAMGRHAVMDPDDYSPERTETGVMMPVRWIDVENVTAPDDDLRYQVFAKGAARFARGEGMWWGRESAFFACTTGGSNRKGQIFRYVPSRLEGRPGEDRVPGMLELYLEPNDHELVANADNLTFAPWGDIVICEDRSGVNDVVGVTPDGRYYKLAQNALSGSEFAGACFSPDGSTLFLSIQADGLTVAVTGPWLG